MVNVISATLEKTEAEADKGPRQEGKIAAKEKQVSVGTIEVAPGQRNQLLPLPMARSARPSRR